MSTPAKAAVRATSAAGPLPSPTTKSPTANNSISASKTPRATTALSRSPPAHGLANATQSSNQTGQTGEVAPAAKLAVSQSLAIRSMLKLHVCPEQITSVPQSTSVISQDVAAPITAFKPVPIFPSVSELRAAVGANGARPALFDSHDDARQLLSNAELLYLLAGLHNSLDRPTLIKAVEAAAKAAGLLGPETPVDLKHVWHQTQLSPRVQFPANRATTAMAVMQSSPPPSVSPTRPSTAKQAVRLFFVVNVKTLSGRCIPLECTPDDTALAVKHMIAAIEPLYQVGRQRLSVAPPGPNGISGLLSPRAPNPALSPRMNSPRMTSPVSPLPMSPTPQVDGPDKQGTDKRIPLENDKLLVAQHVGEGTEIQLTVVPVAPGTFSNCFGVRGKAGLNHFTQPRGLAINTIEGKGRMFVADADNHRVLSIKLGAENAHAWQFGTTGQSGRSEGKLNNPIGLCLNSNSVFVADSFNHRILQLSLDGKLMTTFGSKGITVVQFQFPFGLACSEESLLFVADSSNHRVLCFDTSIEPWRPVAQYGRTEVEGKSEHHLNRPWAVALHQQHLFIADNGNHRVQVFSTETGKLVKSINKWTTIGAGNSEEMTLSHPSGLLIEGDNLYVAELGNKRVSVFSATEFTYRGYFGKKGDASGCFQAPIGLAYWPQTREICVTDFDRHRVSMFAAF